MTRFSAMLTRDPMGRQGAMEGVTFACYDTADYLETEDDIAAYVEAVMEEGGDNPAYISRTLGAVARARNMTALSGEIGMSRMGRGGRGNSDR